LTIDLEFNRRHANRACQGWGLIVLEDCSGIGLMGIRQADQKCQEHLGLKECTGMHKGQKNHMLSRNKQTFSAGRIISKR
jgi:hypothetical protein